MKVKDVLVTIIYIYLWT